MIYVVSDERGVAAIFEGVEGMDLSELFKQFRADPEEWRFIDWLDQKTILNKVSAMEFRQDLAIKSEEFFKSLIKQHDS